MKRQEKNMLSMKEIIAMSEVIKKNSRYKKALVPDEQLMAIAIREGAVPKLTMANVSNVRRQMGIKPFRERTTTPEGKIEKLLSAHTRLVAELETVKSFLHKRFPTWKEEAA